jgi:predicted secreted protein
MPMTGNNGAIIVGGVTLAAVRNFSVEMTRDTIETTIMGKDVRTYVGGMSSFSGSADIYFDPAASTGTFATHSVLNPTQGTVGSGTLSVELYLNDTAGKFSGEVIITGFTVSSAMDGMVEASISFQGSGACTFTA